MKTTVFDIQVLPLPDGSELACVIYRQGTGKLIIQPAFYSADQPALFDQCMRDFAQLSEGVLNCKRVPVTQETSGIYN